MGQIRRRPAPDIRARALQAAARKYADGCVPCAASYLDLARAHGATAREIAAVELPSGAGRTTRPATLVAIGRRKLLQMAATAAVVTLVRGLAPTRPAGAKPLPPPSATAGALRTPAVPGAFGVDSCTSAARGAVSGMPLQFYIGELGATRHSVGCFDVGAAAYATPAFTHGYWGVCGPNARPDELADAAAFGRVQALAALAAWQSNPAVGGRTIFADVESGFGGWGAPATLAEHGALLNAFLQTIAQAGFVPGVYVNHTEKSAWFPTDYVAAAPFVYWMAGGALAGTMPAPCHPADTLHPVLAAWSGGVRQETFGGMRAVVWQYWLSGMGCAGDFDYSPQSGDAIFTPDPVG